MKYLTPEIYKPAGQPLIVCSDSKTPKRVLEYYFVKRASGRRRESLKHFNNHA